LIYAAGGNQRHLGQGGLDGADVSVAPTAAQGTTLTKSEPTPKASMTSLGVRAPWNTTMCSFTAGQARLS
jgi:hypothetical protein